MSFTQHKPLILQGLLSWHPFWLTPFGHSHNVVFDCHKSNIINKLQKQKLLDKETIGIVKGTVVCEKP
jgi:hemolysin-activating ACP:hemolysin acyltransferase